MVTFIRFLAERDPKNLPWKDLGIDVVMEMYGIFNLNLNLVHILLLVLRCCFISPGDKDVDATIVYGVK